MEKDPRDLPVPRSPGSLDRAAFERVLGRAAELQSESGEPTEEFSEEQLVELGREVGLSPANIRQALAEERTRAPIPEDRGPLSGLFGPAHIASRRVVNTGTATASQRLERWMDKEECLQIRRRFQDRITWEARRDFLGSIKRGFNVGGRGYALSSAHEVAASVTSVDDKSALVQLSADYSNSRRTAMIGAGVVTALTIGTGALVLAVASAFGISLLLSGTAALLVAAGGGGITALIGRGNRQLTTRAQLALEQALDRIDQHAEPSAPASVFGTLIDVAVKELK